MGQKKQWSQEQMTGVLEHYALHTNLKAAAARVFGVPCSTVKGQVLGKVSMKARLGHPTVLTAAKEANIEETCQLFAEWGLI